MQRLAEIPFPEVSRLAGSGRSLVILPVGVVEEHGAHLPLGLDSFAAEAYAEAAAPHLEAKGYAPIEQKLKLAEGENRELKIELKPVATASK